MRPRGAVRDVLRDLHAVGVADHVVQEDDGAHPRQLHGARLQDVPRAVVESLGARRELCAPLGSAMSWNRPPGQWPCGESTAGRLPLPPVGR